MSYRDVLKSKCIRHTPVVVSKLLRKTPMFISKRMIEQSLLLFFGNAISGGDLSFFHNRILLIEINDIGFSFYLTLKAERFVVVSKCEGWDVKFSGDSHYFFLLATQQVDPDMLFFQRKLSVTGDTDLGLEIKNFLATQDLEEQLPQPVYRLLGEMAVEVQRYTEAV